MTATAVMLSRLLAIDLISAAVQVSALHARAVFLTLLSM